VEDLLTCYLVAPRAARPGGRREGVSADAGRVFRGLCPDLKPAGEEEGGAAGGGDDDHQGGARGQA